VVLQTCSLISELVGHGLIVENGRQVFGEAGACEELMKVLIELSGNEEDIKENAMTITKVGIWHLTLINFFFLTSL
jgi:hypothetical protein